MKRIAMFVLAMVSMFSARAEDGSRLWLRYDKVQRATVTGPECIAAQELRNYYDGERVNLVIDAAMAQDAYRIQGNTITAKNETGLLYGAYALLRGETGYSAPQWPLRILNHWDNLDGSIERGYAGKSIFWETSSGKQIDDNTPVLERSEVLPLAFLYTSGAYISCPTSKKVSGLSIERKESGFFSTIALASALL